MRTSRPVRLTAVLCSVAVLAGCAGTGEPDPTEEPGPAVTLRVLAGSEVADMQPILDAAATATGVTVELSYLGTLQGAEALAAGDLDGRFDALWFSSNRYLDTIPEAAARLGERTEIMSSPVILGLSAPVAERLGWVDRPVDWREIGETASAGEFTYGMTDPSASNSGFSALVGVATALADSGSALDAGQIEAVTPELAEFFSGQTVSAGSSRWLSGAFTARATGETPGEPVDGMINYESELLALNERGGLPEPLTLIHPSDGVVTADYPLTLLSEADDEAASARDRLAEHLRTPEVQREIMDTTGRRPVVPGVELADRFADSALVELPFPATNEAIDALLTTYFDRARRPSRTVYVLDTSLSMEGERIEELREALTGLTGVDDSALGRYRRFRGREEITLLPFRDHPGEPVTFTIPEHDPESELSRIGATVAELNTGGGTAVYDSLLAGLDLVGEALAEDADRFTSVVLMTDGENMNGIDLAGFEAEYARLSEEQRSVPVFTVPFGEGSRTELTRVAELTGGEVFEPGDDALSDVFREIRGYQ